MARFFTKGFYDFISIYLTMSLITGMMTLWHDWSVFSVAMGPLVLACTCLAYTWWSFSSGPQILLCYQQKPLVVFFLVQVIFYYVLGMATRELGHLYLTLAHAAGAWMYFNFFSFGQIGSKEKSFYLILMVSTALLWGSLSPFKFPGSTSFTSIGSFLLLTIGSAIWVAGFSKHQFRQVFKDMLQKWKLPETSLMQKDEQKDRLFFHDFINLTHGMALFLGHKLTSQKSLNQKEVEELIGEIKTLEKMFQSHYGLRHKNLAQSQDWYSFEKCRKSFLKLIENYLPESKNQREVNFTGDLQEGIASSKRGEILIHFINTHRILTNLIKNIADHSPARIVIEFGHEHGILKINFRNQIVSKARYQDITRHLENAILQSEQDYEKAYAKGLGIESIQELCEELQGSCKFYCDNGDWVTQIELPTKMGEEVHPMLSKVA